VKQLTTLRAPRKGKPAHADSAGRPNKSAEDLARDGIGFQMSVFEWTTADTNRIQRIAAKECWIRRTAGL
jgi:hypothetical protein